MLPQFDTNLLNSAVLWLDDKLVRAGGAYVNESSLLYRSPDTASPLTTYPSPYKGWVYNSCATGATIPSGVYTSSGQFLTRGSGIYLDFNNGRVLSSGDWGGTLSGSFARKEYNVYFSNQEDTDFYLESLYRANQDLVYTATGAPPYDFAAPCVIVTNAHGENENWAFGGLQNSKRTLRLYAISNDPFNQEALAGLLVDAKGTYFPMIQASDMPITFYGDLKSPPYSYCDLQNIYGCRDIFIKGVYAYKLSNLVNKSKFFTVSIIDLDLECVRLPSR